MTKYARNLSRYTFFALALANIMALALTFLSINISYVDAVQNFTEFSQRLLFDIFFVTAAAVSFMKLRFISKKAWISTSAILSLSRLFYMLPYSYLYFEYNGYDTLESITLALAAGAFDFILTLAITLSLSFVAAFVLSRSADADAKDSFGLFDFSRGPVRSAFVMALIIFIYNLIREIIVTVDYLIEYAGTYRVGEIVYMVFTYLFMLVSLVLMHIVGALLIRVFSRRLSTEGVED